jgi:hypothetical protein
VLLAWLIALAPTLAFAAIGLLGSVAFGRSPMGLVIPALLALSLQIAQLLPLPVVVRVVLPSYGFIAWRGLFTDPVQADPLIVGVAVSLAVAVAATALAYRLFMRRDFTDLAYDGAGRRALVGAVLPLAAMLAVAAGVRCANAVESDRRAMTGGASSRGASRAPPRSARRSISSMSRRTAATELTGTDHSRSTASSSCAPRRVTYQIPCGNSTAPSICSPPLRADRRGHSRHSRELRAQCGRCE